MILPKGTIVYILGIDIHKVLTRDIEVGQFGMDGQWYIVKAFDMNINGEYREIR